MIKGILKNIGLSMTAKISFCNDSGGQELYRWLAERFVIIDSGWGEEISLTLRITEEEEKIIKNRLLDLEGIIFRTEPRSST